MVVIVTHGDWSAAWQAGIGIGVLCGLISLVYRAIRRARGLAPPSSHTPRCAGPIGRWLWRSDRYVDPD